MLVLLARSLDSLTGPNFIHFLIFYIVVTALICGNIKVSFITIEIVTLTAVRLLGQHTYHILP